MICIKVRPESPAHKRNDSRTGTLLVLTLLPHQLFEIRIGAPDESLAAYAGKRVAVVPRELPVALWIEVDPEGRFRARPSAGPEPRADAVVRGPILSLVDLMEGRADGDALFFARGIEVEGDSGLVVALRNSLERTPCTLSDFLPHPPPPLKPAAEAALLLSARVLRETAALCEMLARDLFAPAATGLRTLALLCDRLHAPTTGARGGVEA